MKGKGKVRGRRGKLQALAASYAASRRPRPQAQGKLRAGAGAGRPLLKRRGRWLIKPFDRIHEGKKGYNRRRLKEELLWELKFLWGLDLQNLMEEGM